MVRPPSGPARPWWQLWGDPADRASRREYRRSLPRLYRWRRVIVSIVAVVGLTVLLSVLGRDPVGWVKQRWYDLRNETVAIEDVTAAALPPGSVAPSYDVASLPGPREDAWATRWPAKATTSGDCGVTPAAGSIKLTWVEPARVRGLDVWAGLSDAENSERALQPLPKRLDVTFDGECVSVDLEPTAERQRLDFDTERPVSSLTISVGDVFANSAEPRKDLVAIGGIEVLSRPD